MPDLTERTWVRFKLGAMVGGSLVLIGAVWNVALYYSGVAAMKKDMQTILEGQRYLIDKVVTKDEIDLYFKTAEKLNRDWVAPPVLGKQ